MLANPHELFRLVTWVALVWRLPSPHRFSPISVRQFREHFTESQIQFAVLNSQLTEKSISITSVSADNRHRWCLRRESGREDRHLLHTARPESRCAQRLMR